MEKDEKSNDIKGLPIIGDTVSFKLVEGGRPFQGVLTCLMEDGMCDIELAPGSALLANVNRLIDLEIVQ